MATRTYQNHPSFTLETPFGTVELTPTDARHIALSWVKRDGRAVPLTINRVSYNVSAHFYRYGGGSEAGVWNWSNGKSPDDPARPNRYDATYIRRANWTNYNDAAPSTAALNKFEAFIIPAIQQWAKEHGAEMIEAERRHLNNELYSLDQNIEKARAELRAMEQQAATLETQLTTLS